MVPRQEATLTVQPVISMKNMPRPHFVPTHEFIHKSQTLAFLKEMNQRTLGDCSFLETLIHLPEGLF